MKKVEILYKTKNLIVVNKPCGVPSQPDPTGDADALSLSSGVLSSLGEDGTLYPINRLDRVVGGLLVFARNKKSAAALSSIVSGEGFGKEYLAVVSGKPSGGRLVNYLYKDARISKAFVVNGKRVGVKEAVLDYTPISTVKTENGEITLLKVKLQTGRYHQIRCQLSNIGCPIVGDGKYGSRDKGARYPALFSYSLSFTAMGDEVKVSALPDTSGYPWNLFSIEKALEELK
jgi:23S rRNA pseudouridine1911/1915/1917 synthase